MKRSSLIIETTVATLLVFFTFFIINFFPFRVELIKPFKPGLKDFDIYDLYYSGSNLAKNTLDTNIVLVEIANTREEIAKQVDFLKSLKPAVIGVDVIFHNASSDSNKDRHLAETAKEKDSIIWASIIEPDSSGNTIYSNPFFEVPEMKDRYGYVNFRGDKFSVIRSFTPFQKINGKEYTSFSARIAEKFSPGEFDKLKNRNNTAEDIEYSGNLETYPNYSDSELHFLYKTGQSVFSISNKIVLLGFFKKNGEKVLEDIHFTPLNEQFSGRSFPDMYGVVIHANIISMILDQRYIRTGSFLFSCSLAFIFTFLFTGYLLSRYRKKQHPSHLAFLLLQIGCIILLTYLFLLLFSRFHIKVQLLPIIITMVLSVEMISVYKKLSIWLNKKWGYPTFFINR